MKVKLIFKDSTPTKYHTMYFDFIKFLQSKFPLKMDFTIVFLAEREGEMTTGARTNKHVLKILTRKRINRDILRTLAHEWIHEYQFTILGRKRGEDIGGKNENEANAISGQIIKLFEKDFPGIIPDMYE